MYFDFRKNDVLFYLYSPAANNVNLLVETVILNYMALHGEQGNFSSVFPQNGLGSSVLMDSLTAFEPIVDGVMG